MSGPLCRVNTKEMCLHSLTSGVSLREELSILTANIVGYVGPIIH